jgi:hypothetical protein
MHVTRPSVCIGLTLQALLPPSACVFVLTAVLIAMDDTRRECFRLPWAGLFFLPRGHTRSISESRTLQASSSFKAEERKIYSRSLIAMLLLHCELHKLYREWTANAGCKAHTGWRFPHMDHGWEKRTWRTETHCCQRGELETMVPISLQPIHSGSKKLIGFRFWHENEGNDQRKLLQNSH